jgi:hypothetical protein
VHGAAIHETGGARMGSQNETSVLDPYNHSWDVPNLIVTDTSAFPGSGIAGTTLTAMALTVRPSGNGSRFRQKRMGPYRHFRTIGQARPCRAGGPGSRQEKT